MKILLVDDVRLFLELEKTFLRRLECDILTASSGTEALEIARSEGPDLILLDDQMPGLGGLEACRMLKADPRTASIRVLMASAPDSEGAARSAGADGFVSKPLGRHELVFRVRELLPALKTRLNQRAFVRLEVEIIVRGTTWRSWTRDLSATGMFVLSSEPFTTGEKLRVRFRLPGTETPIEADAEVRNAVRTGAAGHLSPGFGVVFKGLPRPDGDRVGEFVRRVESGNDED